MSKTYQRITVSVVVADEDVEEVKREFYNTLDAISEENTMHNQEIVAEECEDPEFEDSYEPAA